MNNNQTSAEGKKISSKLRYISIVIPLILLLIAVFVLVIFLMRNTEPNNIAVRFIKSNEIIKLQAGDITQINGFGSSQKDRSKITAEKLQKVKELHEDIKNSGNVSNTNNSENKEEAKVVKVENDAGYWETAEVVGTKKTLEVKVNLVRHHLPSEFSNDYGFYYLLEAAKFKDENGKWQDIPISWLGKYF